MTLPRRLDVVVVGAGPAGLAAAGAAADAGKGVLLLDQAPRGGGQVWRHRPGDRLPALATRLLAGRRGEPTLEGLGGHSALSH